MRLVCPKNNACVTLRGHIVFLGNSKRTLYAQVPILTSERKLSNSLFVRLNARFSTLNVHLLLQTCVYFVNSPKKCNLLIVRSCLPHGTRHRYKSFLTALRMRRRGIPENFTFSSRYLNLTKSYSVLILSDSINKTGKYEQKHRVGNQNAGIDPQRRMGDKPQDPHRR